MGNFSISSQSFKPKAPGEGLTTQSKEFKPTRPEIANAVINDPFANTEDMAGGLVYLEA